ncbi:reverse transcriptase domain-containing protein, partial [Tanacetum coccineum]
MEHVRRDLNKKVDALSKLASMTFLKLAKEVLVEVLGILPSDPQKARKLPIKAPWYRMIDDKLYRKSYLSLWLRCVGPVQAKNIIQGKHQGSCGMHAGPQSVVEVTNRDIVKGMERRLGKTHQGWVDELPHVLWAHRTTLKSSNEETSFSLVYGSEAVVPIKIGVKTKRIQDFDVKQNEKRRRENLDMLEDRKEIATIREAYYKQKLEGYYNK